jgi:hypothetical protein
MLVIDCLFIVCGGKVATSQQAGLATSLLIIFDNSRLCSLDSVRLVAHRSEVRHAVHLKKRKLAAYRLKLVVGIRLTPPKATVSDVF